MDNSKIEKYSLPKDKTFPFDIHQLDRGNLDDIDPLNSQLKADCQI
jgi:hypothetical protein